MNDKTIKINVADNTERLIAIRKGLGLSKSNVILQRRNIKINEKFDGNIKDLFHPSGLLVHPKSKVPLFVYIRDHTVGSYDLDTPPKDLRKVHFTQCTTLKAMEEEGRLERYRFTNETNDLYLVEFSGYKEVMRPLDPCKNCLEHAGYNCYATNMLESEKNKILREFKAKDAIDMLWQFLDDFKKSFEGRQLKKSTEQAGYVRKWDTLSKAFREKRNFTCERCGVNLSKERRFVDAHHKDGDKRNNKYDNLECLCKACHAKEHSHYKISGEAKSAIDKARRAQGITHTQGITRGSAGLFCARCHVNLGATPTLIAPRHSGLECLCKACHAKADPRYKISREDKSAINKARHAQGIKMPEWQNRD